MRVFHSALAALGRYPRPPDLAGNMWFHEPTGDEEEALFEGAIKGKERILEAAFESVGLFQPAVARDLARLSSGEPGLLDDFPDGDLRALSKAVVPTLGAISTSNLREELTLRHAKATRRPNQSIESLSAELMSLKGPVHRQRDERRLLQARKLSPEVQPTHNHTKEQIVLA